ncbi:MAG: cupin domain-containing protein [Rhodospirillales bacterium]
MPDDASPPPWFFNLHDQAQGLKRELAPGINTRIFVGDNVMLSVVRIEPNAEGTLHSHAEEQWGVVLEGACTRIQDGREISANAGDFWCTRGGVEHNVRAGEKGCTVLDIFSPPREEYKKAGHGYGDAGPD